MCRLYREGGIAITFSVRAPSRREYFSFGWAVAERVRSLLIIRRKAAQRNVAFGPRGTHTRTHIQHDARVELVFPSVPKNVMPVRTAAETYVQGCVRVQSMQFSDVCQLLFSPLRIHARKQRNPFLVILQPEAWPCNAQTEAASDMISSQ